MSKRVIAGLIIAMLLLSVISMPAFAIDNPDSTPSISSINCYRNILETGDFFIFIVEDTPYTTPPDTEYASAFVWRLYDTDGATELAQAVGYNYNDNGYNENVIGFYFDADDAPTWGESYYLKLVGTPVAFDTPPTYTFQISSSDYSSLTDSTEVKSAVSTLVIDTAEDLNVDWGLDTNDYLTAAGEVGSVLSLEGETFFRGAVYGIQALAPSAFSIELTNITSEDREWTDDYSTVLESQFTGTYIEDATDAGNTMLDVDYNLFGLMLLLIFCGVLFVACLSVGGDVWGSLVIAMGLFVIGSRLTLVGLGEVGLVAAIAWLFVSGKVWKVF